MKKIDLIADRLTEIQGKGKNRKDIELSVRIGLAENALLNSFCEGLKITKSRFVRIALGHFASYLDQLSPEEFKQEIQKIIHFD